MTWIKITIILLLTLVITSGCKAISDTIHQIKTDPTSYHQEACAEAHKIAQQDKSLPPPIYLATGYAAAFIRRVFKNWRKEVSLKKKETKGENLSK